MTRSKPNRVIRPVTWHGRAGVRVRRQNQTSHRGLGRGDRNPYNIEDRRRAWRVSDWLVYFWIAGWALGGAGAIMHLLTP